MEVASWIQILIETAFTLYISEARWKNISKKAKLINICASLILMKLHQATFIFVLGNTTNMLHKTRVC